MALLWPLAAGAENLPPVLVPLHSAAPDIVQELRYAGRDNFMGQVVTGYEQAQCLLTPAAVEALSRVQRKASEYGLGLKVYDCYRPQRAVDHFVRWADDPADTRMKARYYPNIAKNQLFELGYIAARSGHSRGSTVDLTLISLNAENGSKAPGADGDCRFRHQESGPHPSLPMGSGYDCFDPVSHTAHSEVSAEARRNRLLLLLLMESEGFSNYDKEWWHFTLNNEPYPNDYWDLPLY